MKYGEQCRLMVSRTRLGVAGGGDDLGPVVLAAGFTRRVCWRRLGRRGWRLTGRVDGRPAS